MADKKTKEVASFKLDPERTSTRALIVLDDLKTKVFSAECEGKGVVISVSIAT